MVTPSRRELWKEFPEVAGWPEHDLARLWAAVVDRMGQLDLIRSLGSVPGEVAESLVRDMLDGELARPGTRGYDVVAGDGRRVQVKALRMTDDGRNTVANFPDTPKFDQLIVVRFAYDMTPLEAWVIEASDLENLVTKGGRLTLTKRVMDDPCTKRLGPEDLVAGEAG